MKKQVLIAGSCLLGLAGIAHTAPPRFTADANSAADMRAEQRQWQQEQRRFAIIDTDGDGFISEQEAQAQRPLLEQWKHADLNSDGKIDQSEFSVFEEEGAQPAKQ